MIGRGLYQIGWFYEIPEEHVPFSERHCFTLWSYGKVQVILLGGLIWLRVVVSKQPQASLGRWGLYFTQQELGSPINNRMDKRTHSMIVYSEYERGV